MARSARYERGGILPTLCAPLRALECGYAWSRTLCDVTSRRYVTLWASAVLQTVIGERSAPRTEVRGIAAFAGFEGNLRIHGSGMHFTFDGSLPCAAGLF